MKILAVDTATPSCSVALCDGGRVLAQAGQASGRTHSRHLMEMIDAVVRWSGVPLSAVEGFGVVAGPGSFTGLRIGIGSIKGLAAALRKPVKGISSLAALAVQAGRDADLICSLIDARRNEVYAALFTPGESPLEPLRVADDRIAAMTALLAGIEKPCLFVGSGAVRYRSLIAAELPRRARFAAPALHTIQAQTVAEMAGDRIQKGRIDDAALLVPRYIRRPDARRPGGVVPSDPSGRPFAAPSGIQKERVLLDSGVRRNDDSATKS